MAKQNVIVRLYGCDAGTAPARCQKRQAALDIELPWQNTIKGAAVQVKWVAGCRQS